ncbi:MAG: redoxin domain-containing protein [Planctomycetota bacterium]|nr:MAG: redoxin domain-containing protein [Planctomycetota bacterium]
MKPLSLSTFALALGGALAVPAAAQEAPKQEAPPAAASAAKKAEPLKVGATVAESLTLKDLSGKPVSFKELRGKVVIVHFWSDRCPAEKHGDAVNKQLEEYYKGKDVAIIAIASNQNELGTEPAPGADYSKHYTNLRDKAKAVGFTHPVLLDHGNKVSDLFQAKSTPHCYVIDKKGTLAYAGALDEGPSTENGRIYVRDAADALLAGKEVETKETKPYG